ncbi:hypothetical protein IA539_17230 [Gordonia sp. zg691]|uniref:Uncharacterized protein n=1 Tax=Gordonia jinghuaiqii TaxID=2758710 RepID=A0A7D7LTG4_9ACTN|nr:hypothetical protein [Gordonia jinghuaiqii]MBD0862929.1 hypothetical protein [Gordonia jinghuaiqii]MCR5978946.1 hypothetical protein [Gordonia jinghuaiqii]QMT01717.1 hypothetical protein H1R19_00435 [Gordonia jinghuaiqii]
MDVRIDGCDAVSVGDADTEDVRIVTHDKLLPYLPGILRLNGIGWVEGTTVHLDPSWSGWCEIASAQGRKVTIPETATIFTTPVT